MFPPKSNSMKEVQNTAPYKNSSNPQAYKSNALVVRLERNLKDINQLRSKLNSYCCEPQTHSLFERIESLKIELEALSRKDQEIIAVLKEQKKSTRDYVEKVKQLYSEFNKLRQGVEEYMGLTSNRYIPG